jgi:Tfp pilus assembly protein FimV
MKWSVRRSLAALALAGVLTLPHAAYAGLGQIEVLSSEGEPFSALIPFVDIPQGYAVAVSLADRNRYPLLSPFSPSASQLNVTLQRSLDGAPLGVLITGPASFSEAELHFAVSMQWAAGGAVREYQVDYRHANPHRKAPAAPGEDSKKSVLTAHASPSLTHLVLGGLKVSSLPGQPLLAEIEVLGRSLAQLQDLQVRVLPDRSTAADDAAVRALVASIQHSLTAAPTGSVRLQLTSGLPLAAETFAFRLEVSLGGVQMARHYQLTAANGAFSVAEQIISARKVGGKTLLVQPGDSLLALARSVPHGKQPLRDVAERLYQNNPQAFIGGDINKLRAGAQLKYSAISAGSGALAAASSSPDEGKSAVSAPEAQEKEALLQAHLRQQEQLLVQAQQVSQKLEQKLKRLHAATAAAATHPPLKKPAVVPAVMRSEVFEGSVALVLAAVGTALALRRRRLRQQQQGVVPVEPSLTIDGMRQRLREFPDEHDLRFRLLQLLASMDDRAGYQVEAEKALQLFEPDGPLWRAVVEMGQVLAPGYSWPQSPLAGEPSPSVAAIEPLAQVEPEPEPEAVAVPVNLTILPERPLLLAQELDGLESAVVEFREPAPQIVLDAPQELDKRELAKLYLEMGDTETARELLHMVRAA